MKNLFILLGTLLLSAPCFADISDSGNLSIGGQGVIQGTMTVVGGIGISTSNPNAQLGVQSAQGSSNFVLQVSSQNSTTIFAIDGSGKLYTPSGGPVANGVFFSNSGAPSWTNAPTLSGTNFSGIPQTAINGGGLPTSVTVSTANIVPGFNGANELIQLDSSGNLRLTGQLVSIGTMTVVGNAFSVGASTLAVTAGSVGINTSTPATTIDVNGNAQFGSGVTKSTFSTTGALTLSKNASLTLSGGSGNVVSASSVTASAFFGDGSHLSGIGIPWIASMSVTGVTCSTFTVVVSSTQYTLNFNLRQVGSSISNSHFYLQFNGDNGANYGFTTFGYDNDFGTGANGATSGQNQIYLTAKGTAIGVDSNDPFSGTATFSTVPGYTSHVSGTSRQGGMGNSSFIFIKNTFFNYAGSSTLSSASLCVNLGSYSGWLYLYNQ